MKKRPIAFFIAVLAAFSAILSGCSCSGDSTLSFNSINATAETLSYTVKQVDDYGSIKKSAELDKYFTFEYSVGTYTTTLEETSKSDEEIKNSDILEIKDAKGDALIANVYKLTTDFEIDLTVTINGQEPYLHKEKITTKTYIASHGASLAPLYAKEDAEYTIISVGSDKAEIAIVKSVSETFYNKDEYRTVKTYKDFKTDETVNLDGVEAQETTTKYTFRSAIDNAELLFAIRGLKIEEKASETIQAVSSGYEAPQPIKITNTALAEKQFTLKNYNGAENVTETIKYSSLSFALDKTNASGTPQYASVQTEEKGNIKNTCLLLEYVKPLITYGTFMSMGALEFTLNSVITN
ncbi:MAG: hypothetical protein VZQ61_05585 [Christensenellaceae bacterium]